MEEKNHARNEPGCDNVHNHAKKNHSYLMIIQTLKTIMTFREDMIKLITSEDHDL